MNTRDGYIVKEAVDITEIDYSDYGILFNMNGEGEKTNNTNCSSGEGWNDVNTSIPIIDTLTSVGYTWSEKQPFVAKEMEKHSHTQEAQLPIEQPIVLCIAKPCNGAPKAEDVIPVIIRPGYIFVLHREVWHSASHGIHHNGNYYWMAQVYQNEPTVWMDVENGPIYVKAAKEL